MYQDSLKFRKNLRADWQEPNLEERAKAQQRARAQALAKAKLDPNYAEPVLGPNLFSESESEAESSQPIVVPYPKLWFWNDGAMDENSTLESGIYSIIRNSKRNVIDI